MTHMVSQYMLKHSVVFCYKRMANSLVPRLSPQKREPGDEATWLVVLVLSPHALRSLHPGFLVRRYTPWGIY